MPDISMCADRRCPSRTTCYRSDLVTTPKAFWQAWGSFDRDEGADSCPSYWPLDEQAERLNRTF